MNKIKGKLMNNKRLREFKINEGLNTSVGKYKRKDRIYCTTMSLINCVMMTMEIHNIG